MIAIAKVQEELDNILAIEEEELTEEKKAEVQIYIDQLLKEQAAKVDGLCQYFKIAEKEAEAYEEEGKRLIAKGKANKRRIEYLKNAAASFMQANGLQKLKGNSYNLSLRRIELVDVFDMTALQERASQFVKTRIEYQPDKIAIKNAIKYGENVPGARIVEREFLRVS